MTSIGERKSSPSIPGVQISESSGRFRGGKLRKKELSVQGDNTWKDVVRHERLVIKLWNSKWDFLHQIPPPNFHRDSIDEELRKEGRRLGLMPYLEFEKRHYHIKPSPPIPLKTSGEIGWRSTIGSNSLELYPAKTLVPKICFPDEQYGRYRKLKYLKNANAKANERSESVIPGFDDLPSKSIRHTVYPLLC